MSMNRYKWEGGKRAPRTPEDIAQAEADEARHEAEAPLRALEAECVDLQRQIAAKRTREETLLDERERLQAELAALVNRK